LPRRFDQDQPLARRAIVAGAVVGVPLSVFLLTLSLRHVDGRALAAALKNAHWPPLLLAVAAMGVVYALQAARWCVVAAAPVRLSMFGRWVLAAIAVNNVVPGRPGDMLRVEWLARAAPMSRSRAFASVVVDRSLDVLVLALMLVLTYPIVQHPTWLVRLTALSAAGGFALVLVLATASVHARRARGFTQGRFRRLVAEAAHGVGTGLGGSRLAVATTLTVLAWPAWAVSAWLV
jgi:glycosyltransferase 2 family protein